MAGGAVEEALGALERHLRRAVSGDGFPALANPAYTVQVVEEGGGGGDNGGGGDGVRGGEVAPLTS